MNCETLETFLDDYLEASLGASETEAVESHLNGCESCRRHVEWLRSLLDAAVSLRRIPERDLWPMISAEIETLRAETAPVRAISPPSRPRDFPIRRIIWPLAAAIILGILGVVAAVRLVTRKPVSNPPKAAGIESRQTEGAAARGVGSAEAMGHKESSSVTSRTDFGPTPETSKAEIESPRVSGVGKQLDSQSSARFRSGVVPGSKSVSSGYMLEVSTPASPVPSYFEIGGSADLSVQGKVWREDEKLPVSGYWLRLRTSAQGSAVLGQLSLLKESPGFTVIDGRGEATMMTPADESQNASEEPIGSYLIRPGETVRINDLQRFNIKPINIRVLSERPDVLTPLRVINRTSSIAVVDIKESRGLRYQLTLRNAGSRAVVGFVNRRRGGLGMRSEPVPPGGEFVFVLGFSPSVSEPPEVTLSMALFEDGSFEGDVDSLALFDASMRIAPKQHARRMLPLLKAAIDSLDMKDVADVAEILRSQIASLNSGADPEILEEVLRKYPSVPRTPGFDAMLNGQADMGEWIRTELLDMRMETEIGGKVDPSLLKTWLINQRKRCEELSTSP